MGAEQVVGTERVVLPMRSVLAVATRRLDAAGVSSARTDAELLLAHCLGVSRTQLAGLDVVDAAVVARCERLLARRVAREALQHILGAAPFRFIELAVGPGVFIPRPETELLIDEVLPALRSRSAPVVVDLCSGSGALALSVASEVPSAVVHAVEHSVTALEWLRINARGTSVDVVAGDVRDASVLAGSNGQVDVVLSNPPYVPSATAVDVEVRHDPVEAVFAGPDGLDLIPAVLSASARLLRPGGVLALEHDDTHQRSVPEMLCASGSWTEVRDHVDLTGRPRYATATRR